MNKLVVIDRPWWRHPIFPWGWLSLRKDIKPEHGEEIYLSGYGSLGDGGGGTFRFSRSTSTTGGWGVIIAPSGGDGTPWIRDDDLEEWSEKGLAIADIKNQPFF